MTDWDALWRKGGFNRWPSEDLVRWASTLEPGSKVLEVGCGAGANLRALEDFGLEAYGVDLSTEALEASVPLRSASREAPVSATELSFPDQMFDAVCDVQCFQHLEQQELVTAYQEAARVLKPGGRFFEVFLARGQEHYPDLVFCAFDPAFVRRSGLGIVEVDALQRSRHGRIYSYVVLECERV